MKLDFLRKVIPLTLSAGMFLSVPAVLPQVADLPLFPSRRQRPRRSL